MAPFMFVWCTDMYSEIPSSVCQIDRFLENTPHTMALNVYTLHILMPVNPSTWKKQGYCKFKAILGYIARICLRKAETKQSFLTEAPA